MTEKLYGLKKIKECYIEKKSYIQKFINLNEGEMIYQSQCEIGHAKIRMKRWTKIIQLKYHESQH